MQSPNIKINCELIVNWLDRIYNDQIRSTTVVQTKTIALMYLFYFVTIQVKQTTKFVCVEQIKKGEYLGRYFNKFNQRSYICQVHFCSKINQVVLIEIFICFLLLTKSVTRYETSKIINNS